MERVSKADFVALVAEKAQVPKKEAKKVIDTLPEVIKSILSQEKVLVLPGFISFKLVMRSKRTIKSPITGKKVVLPKRVEPVARLAKTFRKELTKKRK